MKLINSQDFYTKTHKISHLIEFSHAKHENRISHEKKKLHANEV